MEVEDIVDFSSDEQYDMAAFAVKTSTQEEKSPEEIAIEVEDKAKANEGLSPEEIAAKTKKEQVSEPDTIGKTPEEIEAERVAKEKEISDDKGRSTSPNSYSSFASVLHEEGIISSLDSDIKIESAGDLIDILNKEVSNREFAELNDNQKEYLIALRKGIPEIDIKEYQNVTSQLDSITNDEIDSNQDLRIALIRQDFQMKGMTPERAALLAKRSVDTGDDIADAIEAHKDLKIASKAEFDAKMALADKQTKDNIKEKERKLSNLKKEITSKKEIIPSMKMSEVVKTKLYNQMTKAVGQIDGKLVNAVQKKRAEDPMEFEIKMNYLFQITNGFEDFSKLVTSAKSAATKELEKVLLSSGASGHGAGIIDTSISSNEENIFEKIGELA